MYFSLIQFTAYLKWNFSYFPISGCHLLTVHNVNFQLRLMQRIREAIIQDKYPDFVRQFVKSNYPDGDYPTWAVNALKHVGIDVWARKYVVHRVLMLVLIFTILACSCGVSPIFSEVWWGLLSRGLYLRHTKTCHTLKIASNSRSYWVPDLNSFLPNWEYWW